MIEALRTHKYVLTSPLLAPSREPSSLGAHAEATLTEIVRRDLG